MPGSKGLKLSIVTLKELIAMSMLVVLVLLFI